MLPLLDDDHRMLQEAANGFLSDPAQSDLTRKPPEWGSPDFRRSWRAIADLGWLALPFAEEDGGLDLGAGAGVVLAERLGKHLYPLPYGPTAILPALLRSASRDLDMPVDRILEGEMAIGWIDLGAARGNPLIDHAGQISHLLIIGTPDPAGSDIALAPVDALSPRALPSLDPTCPVAEIERETIIAALADHRIGTVSSQGRSDATVTWRLFRMAEALGTVRGGFELTLAFVRERRQFGVPIGSFQAIKHRLADLGKALDIAGLTIWDAAMRRDRAEPIDHQVDLAQLALRHAATRMRQDVVQFHGALGYTWECDAHLFQKRAMRHLAMLPAGPCYADIGSRYAKEIAA